VVGEESVGFGPGNIDAGLMIPGIKADDILGAWEPEALSGAVSIRYAVRHLR